MKRSIPTLVSSCLLSISLLCQPVLAVDKEIMDTDIRYEDLKNHLLKRYTPIVEKLAAGEDASIKSLTASSSANAPTSAEASFSPWWQNSVATPLANMPTVADGQIHQLFARTLEYSSQMKVFSDLPLIRRTTIQEADGEYDTRLFADGHFSDIDEPVGDKLKTGGPDRYLEEASGVSFGARRKFLPGTEVEVKQQFNRYDNNSEFLDPQDQAQTRTGITVTQPLLKGIGPTYNNAPENLAKIDTASAGKEFQRQMTGHLLEVARAYWSLYMERSIYLQKDTLAKKTEEIYKKMQERVQIDVQPSLLARVKSQMLAHKLDAEQARFAIFNAQSRLWALVNDPELVNEKGLELVTRQQPLHQLPMESMQTILETALKNRPEIDQSINQIQSAVLRHYQSKNEILPDLDLYAGAYASGLKGDYDQSAAFDQEWNEGDPSYNAGLRFEFPLFNNAADARLERKKIEIRQLINQLDTTVTNVLLEAQVSYREMIKYHMAMSSRYEVMTSTNEEISDLLNRIDIMLTRNEDYSSILYQLLDAQERLNEAEVNFSTSELTYNLSLYQLKNVKGTLLADSRAEVNEEQEDDLPINRLRVAEEQASK